MFEAAVSELHPEGTEGVQLELAGLETEAKDGRMIEAFHTNQITINLPKYPSELKCNLAFLSAYR